MRSAIREKLLKQGVADLFQLGDQELKETMEYIAALRRDVVGRRRATKNSENEWLTVRQATKRFGVSAALLRKWVQSAKVRANSGTPTFVNASDLEDAVEQNELFNLTMRVAERDELPMRRGHVST